MIINLSFRILVQKYMNGRKPYILKKCQKLRHNAYEVQNKS